jgi:hypothetical protein
VRLSPPLAPGHTGSLRSADQSQWAEAARASTVRRARRSRTWTWLLVHRWLLLTLVAAILLGELPLLLAACCAPDAARGLGTAWFINDFAQYESAMRQGAQQPGWLIYDVFTAEPHAPAFMFPLYVGLGKLGASLGIEPIALERMAEPIARTLLVLALWRFCRALCTSLGAARAALLLALFGGGFELVTGLVGQGALYSGNWAYETNTFGLLFAPPHVPLAMAASLELARLGLHPQAHLRRSDPLAAAVLSATVALLHPFHLPVLLAALMLSGVASAWRVRNAAGLAVAVAAGLGALPVLGPTLATFAFDPFWSATYSLQNVLPSPAPHELVVDLGPTLLLAMGGAFALRTRVAPVGLLLWLLLALLAMYVPLPYQRRLGFGLQPALAVLAGNTLASASARLRRRQAAWLRLGVAAAAASGTSLVLVGIVASGLHNAPLPVYRSTTDLDAVAIWLDTRARADDVIVADWSIANYLAPRTPARVYGGHPVATLQANTKQQLVELTFASAEPWRVAAQLGATWLVWQTTADAGAPPVAFAAGGVRVYHLVTEAEAGA